MFSTKHSPHGMAGKVDVFRDPPRLGCQCPALWSKRWPSKVSHNVYRERRRRKRRGPRAEGQLPNQKQHGALGMLSRPLGGACPLLLLPWAQGAERQARLPQGRSSLQTGEGVGTTRPQFLGQPDTRQVSERRVRCPGRNKTERGNGGETGLSQHWGQRSENHQQLSKKK